MQRKLSGENSISVQSTFGSKRGLLAFMRAQLSLSIGGFRAYSEIDFSRVERLVFVCKGNICRSAYAEAYARKVGIDCISVGIEATPHCFANDRAIKIAEQLGVSLRLHRSRRLDQELYHAGDLLVGMEPLHLGPMRNYANSAQITLLGLWSSSYWRRPYIHDPYNASDAYMCGCLQFIEDCVAGIASRLAGSPF